MNYLHAMYINTLITAQEGKATAILAKYHANGNENDPLVMYYRTNIINESCRLVSVISTMATLSATNTTKEMQRLFGVSFSATCGFLSHYIMYLRFILE